MSLKNSVEEMEVKVEVPIGHSISDQSAQNETSINVEEEIKLKAEVPESNSVLPNQLAENEASPVHLKEEMKGKDEKSESYYKSSSDQSELKGSPPENDLFSYTKLDDFTSEIYKIEICNLPRYVGYGQLKKFLTNKMKLNPHKIKCIGTPLKYAFITFRNDEDKNNALKLLNGYVWKKAVLTAKLAKPAADPMAQKRKIGDSEDCIDAKKMKCDTTIPVEIRCKNAVTPYWDVPYVEQLRRKQNSVCQLLKNLSRSFKKINYSLKPLIQKNQEDNKEQCCPASDIIRSPFTAGYRNKCEFTVGRHLRTKERTVGFRLDAYKEGSMSVAEPDGCINISKEMLDAVKAFETYVRESKLDVYNPELHSGYWRQLTVRTSNNRDILLIVVMHPQSLSKDDLEEEKSKLTEFFAEGPGSKCGITSVFFHLFSKRMSENEDLNLEHLMGKKHMEESMLDMKFQVSPESFFQINVPATEILYSLVVDIVKKSTSAAVLDVCCGTGTIALCVAKGGTRAVGIEMCAEAVENARLNALQNGLSNVEFICGKAEDVMPTAIQKCGDADEIVAVVDPPRAGLHQKAVKILRDTPEIQKLVYISCNPKAAQNNFNDLCRQTSNNYKGVAFYPTHCYAVDMFPHTPHMELVLVFERSDVLLEKLQSK